MKLPFFRISTVYHVGEMDISKRAQAGSSYEGNGLSVSLCPEAWEHICKLGGNPCHALTCKGGLYLDVHGLSEPAHKAAISWAIEAGLVEMAPRWKAWSWDSEVEDWRAFTLPSRKQAILELIQLPSKEDEEALTDEGLKEALQEALEEVEDEVGEMPPCGSLVEEVSNPVLTPLGHARCASYGSDGDAKDAALVMWTEDVLKTLNPDIVGLWWVAEVDPASSIAPAGAILADLVGTFSVQTLPHLPDDEDTMQAMPCAKKIDIRLLGEPASRSKSKTAPAMST